MPEARSDSPELDDPKGAQATAQLRLLVPRAPLEGVTLSNSGCNFNEVAFQIRNGNLHPT